MRRIICLVLSVFALSACNTYTLQDAKNNGDIILGHLGPMNPGKQKGKDKTSCNKIEKRNVTREDSGKG